jgi:hypothetical protein
MLDPDIPIDLSAVKSMCDLAERAGYSVIWVYHQLNNLKKLVNIPLLHSIKTVKNFKHGWVWHMKRKLKKSA